jgi:hypothetical protein
MFAKLKQIVDGERCFCKQQVVSNEHQTIPSEPQESPLQPGKPEVELPRDPKTPDMPREAPLNETEEVPRQPSPETIFLRFVICRGYTAFTYSSYYIFACFGSVINFNRS